MTIGLRRKGELQHALIEDAFCHWLKRDICMRFDVSKHII